MSQKFYELKNLIDAYQDMVLNTCYGFLHNREDAEDVTQEVFVEVYRSLNQFRHEAQISTWIYRIAISKSLDFQRMQKRKKRLGHLKRIFGFPEEEQTVIVSDNYNPDEALNLDERSRILKAAVDKLPENQRIAITLSKYEGFNNKDIATIMDMSVSAVEALIHRAKKNLRKMLYRYFDEKELK
ncbi:MAG: sigma-70 family RNA polymerase sigma factor [Caldithrix sp.]|nr:sigma-70 family RNA polymerase sigma factor [Caldithrix sp.]